MAHTVKHKKSLLARIRRIKGQANALEGALDSEIECGQILQQIAAIRGAVNGLMMEVIEGHFREHLGSKAMSAIQREKDIDQVVSIFRSYLK